MLGRAVLCVVVVGAGAASAPPQQPPCIQKCSQYFSNPNQHDQTNESWGACTHGCDFYWSLDERTGEKPINTLQNCNYSCDERYGGEFVKSCQAGCGFNYDQANLISHPSPRIESVGPSQQPPRTLSLMPINLDMNGLFDQINKAMPRLNKLVGETFSNPFDDDYEFTLPSLPSISNFPSFPGFPSRNSRKDEEKHEPIFDISFSLPSLTSSLPSLSSSLPSLSSFPGLGRKDDEEMPVFDNLFQNMMQSMPSLPRIGDLNSFSAFPFGGKDSGAKITVIKAGPGYMEEKHYDVGPDGKIVEVKSDQQPILNDALEHVNPLDSNLNESDVEIFEPQPTSVEFLNPVENEIDVVEVPTESEAAVEPEAAVKPEAAVEPVVEDALEPVAEPQHEVKVDDEVDMGPFLSVIRNSLQDGERLKELFHSFHSMKGAQYRDNYSCSSEHLRWSDWVACVHAEMGVPRWLTAATIALGIIFSVWLCLVIPTAAPKKKIKSLVIRTEKLSSPSAVVGSKDAAAAKAAEAKAAEAGENVIAFIKVDIPPSYDVVAPGSPAPSYKSDMLPPLPGSPAPSYKSVDIPAVETKEAASSLEPVHGKDAKA